MERHRLEQELQHYTSGLEQAVSERTQELVASQARYKALFDLVADSVFMVNAAGTVVARASSRVVPHRRHAAK